MRSYRIITIVTSHYEQDIEAESYEDAVEQAEEHICRREATPTRPSDYESEEAYFDGNDENV